MMQYKTSFILTTLGQFLASFNVFIAIHFMFLRFHGIAEYTYSEVLLCFALVLMEFSLSECFTRGFDTFKNLIIKGGFDRILTRPRNEILQVLGSHFELTRIGRMFQAIVILIYAIAQSDIRWCFTRIMTVILMLIGGTALFSGIFLLNAALCFFTLEGLEVVNIFTDGAREYSKYPVNVYGKRMVQFCTFIVPYATVQYYPLLYLTGRSDNVWLVFVPLSSLLFLLPCWLMWKIGVRSYKSSGS